MTDQTALTVDTMPDVLAELEGAFFDIPFENSDFQTRAFVLAAQMTPARTYRAIGLRMFAKINAVKDFMFKQQLAAIDIEELELHACDPDASSFEQRRAQVRLSQKRDEQTRGGKLLNDSLHELNLLYAEFKKLPRFSREQFEAEESKHFQLKLGRQLNAAGPLESLLNLTEDLPAMDAALLKLAEKATA